MWCVGTINEQYRERMYDLIDLYERPYDPQEPVIGVDEKSKQLLGHTRNPLPGKIRKVDYEYKRNGTRNIFMGVEPLAGRRTVQVTKHRKKEDFARYIKMLVADIYPLARLIHIVLDNLNTHFEKSFYETFEPEEAKRILSKVQFHYTPKHASWMNMAEIEIGIMDRQCLYRRIPDEQTMVRELEAWQNRRNEKQAKILWSFSKQNADDKLGKHYV